MQVSVGVRDRPEDDTRALTLHALRPASQLLHQAHIGAGVYVGIDLLAPHRWLEVSVEEVDDTSAPLLAALVGDRALRTLRRGGDTPGLAVDVSRCAPWLRVAAIDALDRWLHLPLDQSFVDAERAVSRLLAAASLPAESAARRLVIADALRLGRNASAGVVRHLRRLTRSGAPIHERLCSALDHLAEGYAELAAQVRGPDRELAAVQQAWRALRNQRVTGSPAVPHTPRIARRPRRGRAATASPIDPRLVPARLLGVSADPGSAELYLSRDPAADGAVRIEVPAFAGGDVDENLARRLLVRVVDRQTSDPLAHGMLTMVPGRRSAARRRFQATVPLAGRALTDVRADVYDVLNGAPPARYDAGAPLREARCATAFLGEWRRLVALARLSTDGVVLGDRLRELAEHVRRAADDADAPPFPGCPPAERILDMLGPDGDPTERLQAAGSDVENGNDLLRFASGAGRLLVAEVASARDVETERSIGVE